MHTNEILSRQTCVCDKIHPRIQADACSHPPLHSSAKNLYCKHTHGNESCHTYEWVMSHIWMSLDKTWALTCPCHLYICTLLQKISIANTNKTKNDVYTYITLNEEGGRARWATHLNESHHTYEWVAVRKPSNLLYIHIYTYMYIYSHLTRWLSNRDSLTCCIYIYIRKPSNLLVRWISNRDSFICVMWLI